MYNRYIPNGTNYTRIPMEDTPEPQEQPGPLPKSETLQESQEEQAAEGATPPRRSAPERGTSAPGPGQTGLGALGSLLEQNPLGQLLKKSTDGNGMNGILKALHLEDLDSGDILLLLILLFLFLEGDNIELVITLGLILLLGLGDDKKDHPT